MSKTIPSLGVGDAAPPFALADAAGTVHDLRDILQTHRVVLIFYPGDMTPGCTMQLCAVRDDWGAFERAGISVFGVNYASAESHERFSAAHHFPFPLLIDKKMEVSKKYGAIKKAFLKTIIRRTVVAIEKDGRIVFYRQGMPKDTDILKSFARQAAQS